MHRITATIRLTVGLVALSLSTLFLAGTLGFVPDPRATMFQARLHVCEAVALSSSALLSQKSVAPLQAHLEAVLRRNPDILRIVVRESSGAAVTEIVPPKVPGLPVQDRQLPPIKLPMFRGSAEWGEMEFHYRDNYSGSMAGWLRRPFVRLTLFTGIVTFAGFYFFLRRMLQHLDPTRAVPDRVRSALNTLAEGLIIVDERERIVLANDAFARTMQRPNSELIGKTASQLGWSAPNDSAPPQLPWVGSLQDGQEHNDVPLSIHIAGDEPRIFHVNAIPVLDNKGNGRGALATFNDVTTIEKSRVALRKMLDELHASRDEIKRQNAELQVLATRDPLTGCFNRRAFFEQFEREWSGSQQREAPLTCVMVDVDHFKSINDRFGHATGDEVLQQVGATLCASARAGDIVCRYGGEEFALLMPDTSLEEARAFAESLRLSIAAIDVSVTSVTASLGVAARTPRTADPHALLNEADKCLYLAKRNGRNRVVGMDQLPDDLVIEKSAKDSDSRHASPTSDAAIPFQAVTALFSALAYRDHATADHSRRVADLSVAVAGGIMPLSEIYILEIAALLHDIGKIGVPDAILLKQSPLTDDEWQVMSRHERIGVEIIHSAFSCQALSEIVRSHRAWFNGHSAEGELRSGSQIPLGARILQITDAYDAMVTERVFRKARSHAEAVQELRRCAGVQFDPDLVERFIEVVEEQRRHPSPAVGPVNKQFALQVGLEIERLAGTLEGRDIHGLETLAARLKDTAARNGVAAIAQVAQQLEESTRTEGGLEQVFTLTQELLSLCRSTQRAFLASGVPAEAVSG